MSQELKQISSGYTLSLTSIGSDSWQLFLQKIDNSSDFIRVVYGITEQKGGATRKFKVLRRYIIVPQDNVEPAFMNQFEEFQMKNRRVWVAFEAVKRNDGKKGTSVGSYIALSPVQSQWRTTIGSRTPLVIKPLQIEYFRQLFSSEAKLDQGIYSLLDA